MVQRPPRPPLFPYTTLFRSSGRQRLERVARPVGTQAEQHLQQQHRRACRPRLRARRRRIGDRKRSEEHTSELQSHVNLVCRLLLEKKKKNHQLNSLAPKSTE